MLGDYHRRLMGRMREINAIQFYEYANKYEESFTQKVLDPDTQSLFNSIASFLTENVKGASVAIFEDATNLKFTPLQPGMTSVMTDKERYWQRVVDVLNHRARNLMKVIEKYSQN